MAEMSVQGLAPLLSKLREIDADLKRHLNKAVQDEAEAIAKRAREEFVPVDEGRLRDSIRVEKAGIVQGRDEGGKFTSEADISIDIVAGGEGIEHAVAVHETPSGYDPPTWKGKEIQFKTGGPKYLEKPLLEAENGMIERIGSKVKLG